MNSKKQMTGDFARNSNLTFPYKNLLDELQVTVSKNNVFLQNFLNWQKITSAMLSSVT